MSNLLDEYYPASTLAEEWECSTRTLTRYENMPDGLPSVIIGGKKYYRKASVKEWLLRRERRPNPRRAA